MPAAGGDAKRITDDSTYSDSSALWTADGKYLVYLQGGLWYQAGMPNKVTAHLPLPLMPETKDKSDKDINSEEDAVKRTAGGGPGGFKGPADKVEVQIDWNKIGRRSRQLTKVADNVGNLAINPDSKTVVFTTSGTEAASNT